jgi:hypothetical protein
MRPISPAFTDALSSGPSFRQLAEALRRTSPQAPGRQPTPEVAPARRPQVDRYEPSGQAPRDSEGVVNGINLKAAAATIGEMLGSAFGDQFDGATISFEKASLREESGARAAISATAYRDGQGSAFDYSASYQAYERSRLDAEGTITTKDGKVFEFSFYQTSGQAFSAESRSFGSNTDWPEAFTPFDPSAAPAASMSGPADQLRQGIPPTDPRLDRLRELLRQFSIPEQTPTLSAWADTDERALKPVSLFA